MRRPSNSEGRARAPALYLYRRVLALVVLLSALALGSASCGDGGPSAGAERDAGECDAGSCIGADAFCEALECERGVCSVEARGCINPPACGSDNDCVDGYFCDDGGECRRDLCQQYDVDCSSGGVCQPASARCANPPRCGSEAECLDGYVCLDESCVREASACGADDGDGGCPANQICRIDDERAACEEPRVCETSFDCLADRQCNGRTCQEPVACRDDLFEPNDAREAATDFRAVARDSSLTAFACEGDVDLYRFDSAELVEGASLGRVVVSVEIFERDRGLGELEVTLVAPDGTTRSGEIGALDGQRALTIERAVAEEDHGGHLVRVESVRKSSPAGVGYRLSVDHLPAASVDACRVAAPIERDRRISDTMEGAEGSWLEASCIGAPIGGLPEKVYELEVDEPHRIDAALAPQTSSADFALSLRRECAHPSSEHACVDEAREGGREALSAVLGEGVHYLIVHALDGDGGPFTLLVESTPMACSSADDYCKEADRSARCASDGSRFRSVVECAEGCQPSTGHCRPPTGDSCLDAPLVEPSGGGVSSFSEDLELDQMSDAHGVDQRCFEGAAELSGGPDQVYAIDLPPNTAMRAQASFASGAAGSLYVLEACVADADGCAAGQAHPLEAPQPEALHYANPSDSEAGRIYLVADTAERESSGGQIEVAFEPLER